MRSPKITTITLEEYTNKYLPEITQAITQILYNPDHLHFSQEELLRAIYNVCCQRHSALLHNDLMECIHTHLLQITQHLASLSDSQFLPALINHLQRYKKSVAVLHPLFRYLERVFVVDKFGSPLNNLFLNTFNQTVIHNPHQKPRLLALLHTLPPNSDPVMCLTLSKELYSLDKDNAGLCPQLFAMYIPCIQTANNLAADIQETQNIISQLTSQGYNTGGSHKRKFTDTP